MVQEEAQSSSVGSHLPAINGLPLRAATRLGPLVLICAALPALYWPAASGLVAVWTDGARSTYLHGFLVVGIALWLLVDRWRELLAAPLLPEPRALPCMLLLLLAWLVAYRAGIQVAYEGLLPLILWVAILAFLGRRMAALGAFPIAFLYFAIPLWDVATDSLVSLTAHVSAALARLTGVATTVDGNLVRVSAGTFEVADGCSGLHYLIVGLAMGALFGELHRQRLFRRVVLLAMAAVLSLAANWIRVAIIVVTGQVTALQSPLVRPGNYHYLFGWLVLGGVLIAYILLGERLLVSPERPSAVNGAFGTRSDRSHGKGGAVATASCALLLLALPSAWAAYANRFDPAVIRVNPLGSGDAGWLGPLEASSGWKPRFPGADARVMAAYRRAGATIEVYVAEYSSQTYGKKFIGYDTAPVGDSDEVLSAEPIVIAQIPILERVLRDGRGADLLLWQWYQVGGRVFASGPGAQLWYGLEAVTATPSSRTVLLRAPCHAACVETRAQLQRFVQDNPWLRFD